MAVQRSPAEEDAVARARTEVVLLMNKYSRRMKTRAVEIALDLMMKEPEGDPDHAGRRAAREAAKTLKLFTRAAQAAIAEDDD